MSTKGKRMADNSGKEENISSESYKYGAYERNKEREEENNMRKKKKMKTRKSSMTMPSVMRICFYTHFPWQCLTAWMERRKRYWSVLNRQSVSCFRQREMSFSVIVYSGKRE